MRTIDSFINETLNSRQVQKEIELDERIAKTYDKYPDLRKIDVKLLDVRRDSMMMLLDGEITEDEIISDSEKKLIEQRAKFLKDNCIMPEFDKIWAVCEKCNDTGYVERGKFKAVCSCMGFAMLLGALGRINPLWAAIIHNTATLAVVLNSARILGSGKQRFLPPAR